MLFKGPKFQRITREQELIFGIEIICYFFRLHSTAIKSHHKTNEAQPNKALQMGMHHRVKRDTGLFVGVQIAFSHFKGLTCGWL